MPVSPRPTSRPSALPLPAPRSLRVSNAGSALILVLLVIALLTATVVGFLSTARIEQLAARNFSQQNAASGLAELATQQAMAKISLGFNTTGNLTGNYTSVVTTQPGAIHKYFFQNGTVTQNTTVELFSSGNLTVNSTSTALAGNSSNGTANMNNLSYPMGTVAGSLTLTGNSSEQINVAMEEVNDSEGNLVGRIAYYVDDESTKINMNAATGDRTTLNVSTPRSNSLSALTSNNSTITVTSSQVTLFQNVIDGNGGSSGNLSNWAHFFRNEQLSANTTFNATAAQLAQLSTAPLSDFHLKYTPWGDTRLHINDVPLNSTGVEEVYAALSSPHLTNIYGQNFNDKYGQNWSWTGNISQTSNNTVNGLKQTIANMLQMRTPGSHDIPTVRSPYTGPVISENGTVAFPPSGYYADIPAGCINEFGFKINYRDFDEGPGGRRGILLYPMPIIEFLLASYAPYGDTGNVHLEARIQSLTFTLQDSLGNTTNRTIGPLTLRKTYNLTNANKYVTNGTNGAGLPGYTQLTSQQNIFNNGATPAFNGNNNLPWAIVGSPTLVMGDVKLFAGSSNSSDALRDWLTGEFIMSKLGSNGKITLNTPFAFSQYAVKNQTPSNPPNFLSGNITSAGAPRVTTPYNPTQEASYNSVISSGYSLQSWSTTGNATTSGVIFRTSNDHLNYEAGANFSGDLTLQRIDSRVKGETAWVVAPYTYPRAGSAIYTARTTNVSTGANGRSGGHNTYYGGYGLRPSDTETRDIPGDPSPMGDNEPDYFITTEHSWIYFPRKLYTLDSNGNATFNAPHDLGKVPTNVNWRRLRFMPRHQRENARNLIPDWAMLDVISFSSNNSSASVLKIAPINPNGSFALDSTVNNSSSTLPTPRNNLNVLLKALESSSPARFKLGSAIAQSGVGADITFDQVDMSPGGGLFGAQAYTYFRGNATIATSLSNNIRNQVWSTQNGTWTEWRSARGWPNNSLILPGEVTEISGAADYGGRTQYEYTQNTGNNAFRSIKENEGRLTAFFPGLTLQSNLFTIYAFAQAGQLQNKNQPESASNPFIVDSESLTKTLVEIEIDTPATATDPAVYKVKKLYTQPILLGQ